MTRLSRPRIDDPRFQRSLKALNDAIIGEVDQSPLSEISITRIVQTAGVTRPTFYQHFADIPDAARRAALVRLSDAFPIPQPLQNADERTPEAIRDRIERQAIPILTHLFEHKDFYLRVLEGATNIAFFEEVIGFVSARLLPEVFELAARRGAANRQDLTVVMASGITVLLIRWLREDIERDPHAMARRCAGIALTMMSSSA